MKKDYILFVLAIIFFGSNYSLAQNDSIDYFGQTPPGDSAVIFAPGIISQDNRSEGNISFSPEGNRCMYHVIDRISWQWGDIYYSEYENNNWNIPVRADFIETSDYFDIQPSFSPDGKTLYYSSLNPYRGYTQGGIYVNLWKVEYDSVSWKTPEKLNSMINSSNNDETFPNFTLNGTLYFQKDQTGFLWYSKLEAGEFKEIKKLEKPINSTAGYYHPYVAPDANYMILNSDRDDGFGSSDLYISYNKGENKWTNPKNIGNKINTEVNEGGPTVSPDGKYLFFGRSDDIYWARIDNLIDSLKQTNFIPYLLNSIPDQKYSTNDFYTYSIPDSIFFDDDGNETLSLSVTTNTDENLPDSLSFDPLSNSFNGKLLNAGIYDIKITATDTAGASVSDIFKLTVVQGPTGINDINANKMLFIFPNPANHTIQVSTNGLMDNIMRYQIIDMSGKIVKQARFNSEIIEISELNKGLYLLNLKTDKEIISKKIMLE